MPYTPPFRTRRSPQRLVEPHLGEPDSGSDTPKATLTWTTASARPLADDATHAAAPAPPDDDDDALPVLTQLVEPPAAPVAAIPAIEPTQPTQEPVAEPEPVDEELVARITDDVLDALQPVLHDLVGNAVRRALEDHIRQGGER